MMGHTFGSARGIPYLGEFYDSTNYSCYHMYGCYYEHLFSENWTKGCPTLCGTCTWDVKDRSSYNLFDPYNTSYAAAPKNYTTPAMWGDACTQSLTNLGYHEYTNDGKYLFRLPVEISMLQDDKYVAIMKGLVYRTYHKRTLFGIAYSKLLEVGVPEEDLYEVVSYAKRDQ